MEITLSIKGQELTILGTQPSLYHGSVGVLFVKFLDTKFDTSLIKTVRFKTAESDWYTADVIDGRVRVPHEVIVAGGFDIAVAGYDTEGGELQRFLPTNSVHIDVLENGFGDPDAPLTAEEDVESVIAKYEKKADMEFVERLIPRGCAKGEILEITDHLEDVEAPNYRIYGNSSQKTRSGINLLDNTKIKTNGSYGDLVAVSGNKAIYTTSSQCYGLILFQGVLKPDTDYTITFDMSFTGRFAGSYGIRLYMGGGYGACQNNITTYTFRTDASGDTRILYYVGAPYNVAGDTLTVENLMLLEGAYTEENMPLYEEYGLMPSPEFPSEIHTVGDENGAMFNVNDALFSVEGLSMLKSFDDVSDVAEYELQEVHRRVERLFLTKDMDWQEADGVIYCELEPEKFVDTAGMEKMPLPTNYSPRREGWFGVLDKDGTKIGFDISSGNWPFSNADELIEWLSKHKIYTQYPLKTAFYEKAELPAFDMIGEKLRVSSESDVPALLELTYYQDINKKLFELESALGIK